MQTNELMLIDFSSLAVPIWKMSSAEPDPNHASTQMIARVRALASDHPHCAICADSGKSFRNDLDPTYKANRPESDAPMHHQMTLALETLKRDGFPVWKIKGYEADDLVATGVTEALKIEGASVLVVSSDKDLLSLVNDRVRAKSIRNGNILDAAEVFNKLKVHPHQVCDYLSLVGDASDNIKGARGVGEVTAAKLLAEYHTLDGIYAALDNGGKFTDSIRNSLTEFRDRWPLVRSLVALKTDVEIPFAEIAAERVAAPMKETPTMTADDYADADMREPLKDPVPEGTTRVPFEKGNDANDAPLPWTAPTPTKVAAQPDPRPPQRIEPKPSDIAVQQPVASAAPVDFSQQLEPRTMDEAKMLAKYAFASRMFSAYGTEQAVLMVLMAGRELGMTAMASLRGFHLVEGRATLSADLIRALIIRSGQAKYFRPTERTSTRATWETQRGDDPPVSLSFTIEEAQQAGVVKNGSGWTKYPADMLTARASAKLARLVYSDIVFNLYDPSEIG